MSRYFEDSDAYGNVCLWVTDGPYDQTPQPVLFRDDVRRDQRDHLWPLIVEAVTNA